MMGFSLKFLNIGFWLHLKVTWPSLVSCWQSSEDEDENISNIIVVNYKKVIKKQFIDSKRCDMIVSNSFVEGAGQITHCTAPDA